MNFTRFKSLSLLLFLTATSHLLAQFTITGRIEAGPSSDIHHLTVQLLPLGGNPVIAETNPTPHGDFEITSPSSGVHTLRILSIQGNIIQSQSITLPYHHTLVIELRQAMASTPPANPVSLARLQHKVPAKAFREFAAARKAASRNQQNEAIAHLEKAIAIDPEFFEAINNLAVQRSRQNRWPEAHALFERAASLDPSDPIALTNLAFTLLRFGRHKEAEQTARAAVRANSLSPRARFYLAISLLEQNKARSEAIYHLSQAGPEFEPARVLLQKLRNETNSEP